MRTKISLALILVLGLVARQFSQGRRRPSAPAPGPYATANQVLTWNGSAWVAANVPPPSSMTLAGDVTGTTSASVVGALRGKNISTTAPTAGQNLTFDGTNWTPTTPAAATGGVLAAGTITVSNATTATHNFTTALPSGAVCQIEPQFDPASLPSLTYWPSNTTSSVTVNLSSAGSGTFNFMCSAASN